MKSNNLVDFQDEFKPEAKSLYQVFQKPGRGFVIPYYQREYSWGEENIKQLMDDLIGGTRRLIGVPNNIRFLGTSILMKATDELEEIDNKSKPTRVDAIIDGQQRISTFALLSIVIHYKIKNTLENINSDIYDHVEGPARYWMNKLETVYSLDPGFGIGHKQPVVIRQGDDIWNNKGDPNQYQSDITYYLAKYIDTNERYNQSDIGARVRNNITLISDFIDGISKAHINGSDMEDTFPSDVQLAEEHIQKNIWGHQRETLTQILFDTSDNQDGDKSKVHSLANLFALSSFFMDRCCMTIIEPSKEELAFDMFQSLNATGTPLTAIEVFKPLVVKLERDKGKGYKNSPSQKHFENINNMFSRVKKTSTKNRRTNQLMRNFALSYDGKKLSNRFGEQRKWIQESYRSNQSIHSKRDFTKVLSDVSSYIYDAWMIYGPNKEKVIDILQGHDKAQLASTCFLYLQSVNHNIANGHLARFYANVINDTGENPKDEFADAVIATAAFFTLWRATQSTSGLDNVYRRLMKHGGLEDDPVVGPMRWTASDENLTVENLKKYFRKELSRRNLDEKDTWVERSTPGNLTYDTIKNVCRFCLFLSAHDTIPDDSYPGLMKKGKEGSSPYLTVDRWVSDSLELEHVAPLDPSDSSTWDTELYKTGTHQEIGNLTLLPKDVNVSASNKSYKEKKLYYQHLGIDDPEKVEETRKEAEERGIELSEDVTETLTDVKYHKHISPLISKDNQWNYKFVKDRGRRISEIVWDRISPWIFD